MLTDPKLFLANIATKPGVYQMFDSAGKVLYVGKAKNLKKRLASYFRATIDPKTASFMVQLADIQVIITANETEALLLEYNLIKKFRPRYNVLFKDDKSFLYILLTKHDFPRLLVHRGPKKIPGKYFGPYPNSTAVYETIHLLQKIFNIRNCDDNVFAKRSRPCLQCQIQKCSGPCVGEIDASTYQNNVNLVERFLKGENDVVIKAITANMECAVTNLAFEKAAFYRDQISNLRFIWQQQSVINNLGNLDAIASVEKCNEFCINVVIVRNGQVLGSRTFFPDITKCLNVSELLETFLEQYYLSQNQDDILPKTILVNNKLTESSWIAASIVKSLGQKVTIVDKIKGKRKNILAMATTNALYAVNNRLKNKTNFKIKLTNLQQALLLDQLPQKIECFDVSHLSGAATVVACVVFGEQGPLKKEYRKYNIRMAKPNDDFGALQEALKRRYEKLEQLPDVILIDGGIGQLNIAKAVITQLRNKNKVNEQNFTGKLLAIAKGKDRKPGFEKIYTVDETKPLNIASHSLALLLLQQIRDEAHRFALASHRESLASLHNRSSLEKIFGIGKGRRIELLKHFGGLQGVENATINDLAKVSGISFNLAQRIYTYLHG
jgi:excinuclease ABC subunit C